MRGLALISAMVVATLTSACGHRSPEEKTPSPAPAASNPGPGEPASNPGQPPQWSLSEPQIRLRENQEPIGLKQKTPPGSEADLTATIKFAAPDIAASVLLDVEADCNAGGKSYVGVFNDIPASEHHLFRWIPLEAVGHALRSKDMIQCSWNFTARTQKDKPFRFKLNSIRFFLGDSGAPFEIRVDDFPSARLIFSELPSASPNSSVTSIRWGGFCEAQPNIQVDFNGDTDPRSALSTFLILLRQQRGNHLQRRETCRLWWEDSIGRARALSRRIEIVSPPPAVEFVPDFPPASAHEANLFHWTFHNRGEIPTAIKIPSNHLGMMVVRKCDGKERARLLIEHKISGDGSLMEFPDPDVEVIEIPPNGFLKVSWFLGENRREDAPWKIEPLPTSEICNRFGTRVRSASDDPQEVTRVAPVDFSKVQTDGTFIPSPFPRAEQILNWDQLSLGFAPEIKPLKESLSARRTHVQLLRCSSTIQVPNLGKPNLTQEAIDRFIDPIWPPSFEEEDKKSVCSDG